jgi:hypothetical protein
MMTIPPSGPASKRSAPLRSRFGNPCSSVSAASTSISINRSSAASWPDCSAKCQRTTSLQRLGEHAPLIKDSSPVHSVRGWYVHHAWNIDRRLKACGTKCQTARVFLAYGYCWTAVLCPSWFPDNNTWAPCISAFFASSVGIREC